MQGFGVSERLEAAPAFSVQTFGLRSGLYWVRLKGFILRYRNKETR